jgi:hypothetical protein
MPRDSKATARETGATPPDWRKTVPHGELEPPQELRDAIRPWVDLDEVGLPGLWLWLLTVLPLLPPPPTPEADTPVSRAESGEVRVHQLAKALVDCATHRARLNFQASEYYVDNALLARRVRALEGMLRSTGKEKVPLADAKTEQTTERYLPRRSDGAREQ